MKFSLYNLTNKTDDGNFFIYNTFTRRIASFTHPEQVKYAEDLFENKILLDEKNEIVQSLYTQGFIVDDNRDEFLEVKQHIEDGYEKRSRYLQMMVYATLNCNFRCVYCSQRHVNVKLSDGLWEGLYNYIKESLEKKLYDAVTISFFGGEPLLEYNKIVKFLEKLKELNTNYPDVFFEHTMTTNGSLLKPEMFDKLVELNLRQYQITLDGFSEYHNTTRPFADGRGSWDMIIDNLKYINSLDSLEKQGVQITLRVNINDNLAKNLNDFKQWLQNNFNNQVFKFDFCHVFKPSVIFDDVQLDLSNDENRKILSEAWAENNSASISRVFDYKCKCCNKNFYCLLTNGDIIKCERDYEDNPEENIVVGKLTEDGQLILNEYADLFVNNMETERCKTCVIYPICGARSCPYKKVISEKNNCEERLDCITMIEDNFYSKIAPFIKDKLMTAKSISLKKL